MFRALKDILQDGKPHQHDKYAAEGKTAAATTRTSEFSPVENYPREERYGEGLTKAVPIVEVERRELYPVVQETIHPTERIEIQPILRREREQIEVREITQPILEKGTFPVAIHEELLPEERKVMPPVPQAVIEEQLRKAKEGLVPTKKREPTVRTVEEKPAIVEEKYRKKIYEEIVPVVERHINEPHIIREKKPIYEKIYEGPTISCRELPRIEREVPVQYGQQSFKYSPAGGAVPEFGYGEDLGREEYRYQGQEGYYGSRGGQYFKGQPGVGSFVDVPVHSGYMTHTALPPGQVRYA